MLVGSDEREGSHRWETYLVLRHAGGHAKRHANCGNILIVCHVGRHVSVARHVEVRALTLVAGRFSLPVLCNSAMHWSRVPTSS